MKHRTTNEGFSHDQWLMKWLALVKMFDSFHTKALLLGDRYRRSWRLMVNEVVPVKKGLQLVRLTSKWKWFQIGNLWCLLVDIHQIHRAFTTFSMCITSAARPSDSITTDAPLDGNKLGLYSESITFGCLMPGAHAARMKYYCHLRD